MTGYQLKGTFSGFQTSRPIFDDFAKKSMEATKIKIKSVGIIKVTKSSTKPRQDKVEKN